MRLKIHEPIANQEMQAGFIRFMMMQFMGFVRTMTMRKCDTCLNSRPIISENGIHYVCTLSESKLFNCLIGRTDEYEQRPEENEEGEY